MARANSCFLASVVGSAPGSCSISCGGWAAERTSFPSEVVEMALAHAVSNRVDAAYRRGDLFEKRRRLMDAWGEFCGRGKAGGEVVPLKKSGRRSK